VRHQGETTTSQSGWHPEESSSYAANLKEILFKNKGKDVQKED